VAKHFRRIADERRTAVVLVTHDSRLRDFADNVLDIRDGRIA
jgi:ABC-type lipoprotein export system ATPase subunit